MFNKYFFFIVPFTISALFLSLPGFSKEKSLQRPFFLSVSGSGGARLNEDFSYLINPALLAFQKRKKIGLSYSFKNKNQTAVLSVADNKITLPVALSYQRWWSDSFQKGAQNKLFLSSSFKLYQFFSLGLNIERNLQAPYFGNGSLGSFLRLSPRFGLALFLDNILKENDKNLRLLTLSGSYLWKGFFSIQSDLSRSARKEWILRGGLESLFHPLFSFQLGGVAFMKELSRTTIENYLLSGGLSFHSPKFTFQYGLQTDYKNEQHSLSLLIKI